jgi:hypothetical protein
MYKNHNNMMHLMFFFTLIDLSFGKVSRILKSILEKIVPVSHTPRRISKIILLMKRDRHFQKDLHTK